MTIQYRIYKGDASGGPVDYSTVVATVPGTSWTGPPLAAPSSTRFAVRSFDPATGLDDGCHDAEATATVDAAGNDASGTPSAPFATSARPGASGAIVAHWAHAAGGRPIPAGFRVWATPGPSVDYSSPPGATVTFSAAGYRALGGVFSAAVPGLAVGVAHAVAVRAFNAAGDDGSSPAPATATPASPPLPVASLVVVASPIPSPSGRAIPGTGGP